MVFRVNLEVFSAQPKVEKLAYLSNSVLFRSMHVYLSYKSYNF